MVHVGPKFWLILLFLSLSTIFFFKSFIIIISNGNNDCSLSSNYLPYPIYNALHAASTLTTFHGMAVHSFWVEVKCGECKELGKVTHSEVTEP